MDPNHRPPVVRAPFRYESGLSILIGAWSREWLKRYWRAKRITFTCQCCHALQWIVLDTALQDTCSPALATVTTVVVSWIALHRIHADGRSLLSRTCQNRKRSSRAEQARWDRFLDAAKDFKSAYSCLSMKMLMLYREKPSPSSPDRLLRQRKALGLGLP